jgi:Mycobacterium membrane protein
MKRIFIPLAVFFLCFGCGSSTAPHGSSHDVEYLVTGTGTDMMASINYVDENGDSIQDVRTKLPWSYPFTARKGALVFVSAKNLEDTGMVTTEIFIDGEQEGFCTDTLDAETFLNIK